MATLGTLGQMMLAMPPQIAQYDPLEVARQQNIVQGGRLHNQTALLQLEELRRTQGEQAAARQFYQTNPDYLLGGGSTLGTLNASGPPGAITQGPLPGMPGATQTIGAPQDLSQYASGTPPPTIGGMPQPRPDPLRALAQTNPDAALQVMDTRYKVQERVLGMQEKKLAAFGQILQGATDQPSWDRAREWIGQIDPAAAAQMGPFFNKEQRDQMLEQALSRKDALTLQIQGTQAQSELAKYNLQLQHAGYQGLGTDVTGILKGLTPEQVQEFGGRTSDKAIAYATQKAQEMELARRREQGAAGEQEKPLEQGTRDRLAAYRRGEQLAHQLQTEFTPEERAKYVGMGGMRMTGKQIEQWLQDATKRQADPRFARFLTLLNEAKTEAFATGGKALTQQEADVVFGYIPTGKETSVEQFEQKLSQARERSTTRFDEEMKLATTPRRAIAEQREPGGALARPAAPRLLSSTELQHLAEARSKALGRPVTVEEVTQDLDPKKFRTR